MSILTLLAGLFLMVQLFIGGMTSSQWLWNKYDQYRTRKNINHSRIHLAKWVKSFDGLYLNLQVEFDGDKIVTVKAEYSGLTVTTNYSAFSDHGGWRDHLAGSIKTSRKLARETYGLICALRGDS